MVTATGAGRGLAPPAQGGVGGPPGLGGLSRIVRLTVVRSPGSSGPLQVSARAAFIGVCSSRSRARPFGAAYGPSRTATRPRKAHRGTHPGLRRDNPRRLPETQTLPPAPGWPDLRLSAAWCGNPGSFAVCRIPDPSRTGRAKPPESILDLQTLTGPARQGLQSYAQLRSYFRFRATRRGGQCRTPARWKSHLALPAVATASTRTVSRRYLGHGRTRARSVFLLGL
jgi:hypothetical protein